MATKKAARLVARAEATTRQPKPTRLLDTESQKKGYRIVAVSLYTPEADWVDYVCKALQRAGSPKANRSLVIREAILRLQEDLKDKTPAEMLQDFTEHQAKRTGES
jgi:hypothetical protein